MLYKFYLNAIIIGLYVKNDIAKMEKYFFAFAKNYITQLYELLDLVILR